MMTYFLVAYAGLVGALTLVEFKENRTAQCVIKPAAAFGFVLMALLWGNLDDLYGRLILFGLIACAAGDVFLLSRTSPKLFLAGMAAFAFGHLFYLTAFVTFQDLPFTAGRLVVTGLVIFAFAGVFAWLKPHLPKEMGLAVAAYVFIILLMVINALGLPLRGPLSLAMIGAGMFAVSDIFVARDRFVSPDPGNAIAITPLYFGAQALIALSSIAVI